jgi:tetratricopeptide (TPR) repeat protein
LAVFKYQLNQVETALTCSERALEYNSNLPEAIYNYAVLLEKVGRENEATKHYMKLYKMCKYEEFVKNRLEWIQNQSYNPQESLRDKILHLKHPENVIKNTLIIEKTNKKIAIKDTNKGLPILNVNKIIQLTKSPERQVRFMNVKSCESLEQINAVPLPRVNMNPPLQKIKQPVVSDPVYPNGKLNMVIYIELEGQDKPEVKQKTGLDVLARLRASEKEKLSNHKPMNTLGETAKWKVFSKSKFSQNGSIDQPKDKIKLPLRESAFEGSLKVI